MHADWFSTWQEQSQQMRKSAKARNEGRRAPDQTLGGAGWNEIRGRMPVAAANPSRVRVLKGIVGLVVFRMLAPSSDGAAIRSTSSLGKRVLPIVAACAAASCAPSDSRRR
jgi:hypothetical protein